MLLLWHLFAIIFHGNVDEWYDLGLQSVFGSFCHNDEFLVHLWSNFQWDLFLKLFGYRIFNKPAIELYLRVLDASSILVFKRELISIVLAENGVTIILFLLWNRQFDLLVHIADISKQKCRPENFSANKLSVINYVRIYIKNIIDILNIGLFLSFGLDQFLVSWE